MVDQRFELSGAEKFSRYLEQKLGGGLSSEAQEVNGEACRKYTVKRNGEIIGVYTIHDQRPGENDSIREFVGRIAGYVNDVIANSNKGKPEDKKVPEDRVYLIYANEKRDPMDIPDGEDEGPAKYWSRHDHNKIDFP